MTDLQWGLTLWLGVTAVLFMLPTLLGMLKIRLLGGPVPPIPDDPVPVEVLVPIKGVFPDQTATLESWLTQNHPRYGVIFILESEDDPATPVVDDLCARYDHARKVISGLSTRCAQKNHNLIAGTRSLRPDTRIILFCDSTNTAPPDWLLRFVAPLEAGLAEVVTTFRSFDPKPETLGGVAQAVYASFLYLLMALAPKPWGGATAIRRETFERLNVAEMWSRTVVDDLVLGNILQEAGLKVWFDHRNVLMSPLSNQSVKGFLDYLDRQILFPKFTNPGIWGLILGVHTSVSLAAVVSLVGFILYFFGTVSPVVAAACSAYLGSSLLAALLIRSVNPFSISIAGWFAAFLPTILLAEFVLLRSAFCTSIVWHGRTYRTGSKGVVLSTGLQPTKPGSAS